MHLEVSSNGWKRGAEGQWRSWSGNTDDDMSILGFFLKNFLNYLFKYFMYMCFLSVYIPTFQKRASDPIIGGYESLCGC